MKQRHRPGEEHIRGNLTNPTPQLRPESTRAPMWPPILPRFSSGGGGGQGSNFNYGDMEQWLPGRISSSKNSKSRHSRKPIPNNPEYEIYEDDGER